MSENVSMNVTQPQIVETTTNTEPVAHTAPVMVQMSLVTVQNLRNILDICGERGTFKTAEMMGVGMTYNELVKVLESNTPQKNV